MRKVTGFVTAAADRLVGLVVPGVTAHAADCDWEYQYSLCRKRWCCYRGSSRSCGGWQSAWPNCGG